MLNVIIVNGYPRSGKDTFINLCLESEPTSQAFYSISSVDFIKQMLTSYGVNIDNKTEKDRKLISGIGNLLEEHSEIKTKKIKQRIFEHLKELSMFNSIHIFVQIRENNIINNIINWSSEYTNIQVIKLLITSNREQKITSNNSDKDIINYIPDLVIQNNGSIEDLQKKVDHLFKIT
jgi:dephospho-CoA kinase